MDYRRLAVSALAAVLFASAASTGASAQDRGGRYASGDLVARLKSCVRLRSGAGNVTAVNECDVVVHVLACARDQSGCDDSEVGPGGEQRLQVVGLAEFYACPSRSNAVDMNDNPIASAFVPRYRCMWS